MEINIPFLKKKPAYTDEQAENTPIPYLDLNKLTPEQAKHLKDVITASGAIVLEKDKMDILNRRIGFTSKK